MFKMPRNSNHFANRDINIMRNTHSFLVTLSCVLLFGAFAAPSIAAQNEPLLDKGLFSIGAGISDNSAGRSRDDETGYQFFAAYALDQINLMEGVKSSVEFGFMDYGFSRDHTGIWGTYVIGGSFGGQLGWLGRLGLDIGDDSGLMAGAGVGYASSEQLELRLEYVVRDEIDSLQFNFLFHL